MSAKADSKSSILSKYSLSITEEDGVMYSVERPPQISDANDLSNLVRQKLQIQNSKQRNTFINGGQPRVHPLVLTRLNNKLIEWIDSDTRTLADNFWVRVEKTPDAQYLGHRPIKKVTKDDGSTEEVAGHYVWETYGQIGRKVLLWSTNIRNKLRDEGVNLDPKTNVGLYSINRPEWVIAEQVSFMHNWVTVPLYDTLGKEALSHICTQTAMPLLFASTDRALNLLKMGREVIPPGLKWIVLFDEVSADKKLNKEASWSQIPELAAQLGINLIQPSELLKNSPSSEAEHSDIKPEDLCTICYTSGTTGTPKGVMLTHAAIIAIVAGVVKQGWPNYNPQSQTTESRDDEDNKQNAKPYFFRVLPTDVHLSYLPLAHIFERINMAMLTWAGGSVGFYQGDPLKLLDDVAALQPTMFVTVPRVCNRIYDKTRQKLTSKGFILAWLFGEAMQTKLANLRSNGQLKHWLWDRVIFSAIRKRLGTRLRCIVSGSAPLSPEVLEFMRVCFGCEVYEGYGQTETSAGTCMTQYEDWSKAGHVGTPNPACEVKLVDVPEMGYYANPADDSEKQEPRGEICIRGPLCFSGYYKDEARTKETIDAEGWVHTGDIGAWDPQGRLRIIDRKKNIFKLAQGEYVAPERVENVLCTSQYIQQAFVHGNSLENCTVAIIIPDEEALRAWIEEKDILTDVSHSQLSLKDLLKIPAVGAFLARQVESFGKTGSRQLTSIELPRAIYLESVPFSPANSLMTSTFKVKRLEVIKAYAATWQACYEKTRSQVAGSVTVLTPDDYTVPPSESTH